MSKPRAVLLLTTILTFTLGCAPMQDKEPSRPTGNGLITKTSPHSVDRTLDRLETVLLEKGITVFARIDHARGARKAGRSLEDTQLMIFGNPKLGTPLMQSKRSVAIDLPLKALAWKDDRGRVWLSYNDPRYIANRHGIEDREEILDKMSRALDGFTDRATGE